MEVANEKYERITYTIGEAVDWSYRPILSQLFTLWLRHVLSGSWESVH